MGQRNLRWVAMALSCASAMSMTGCYRYTYVERNGPQLSAVPIDRNLPQSTMRWGYLWGIPPENVWKPAGCTELEADGSCAEQIPMCDEGIGEVTVGTPGYALPLALVTLGLVMPMKITVYCATSRSSGAPPVGP